MKTSALGIWLHDQRVGSLQVARGRVALRFDPAWRARPDRRVLSAHHEDDGNIDPRPLPELPPYFANLTFEGRLEEWIARSEGLPRGPLELLARVGRDLPGAVRLLPVDEALEPIEVDDGAPPTGGGPRGRPRGGPLRWSLAGVQLKLSVAPAGERFTSPVHGQRGCFIAKFADRSYAGVPEVEHATMSWARAAGICTAEAELRPVSDILELPFEPPDGDEPALLVRRFDRSADGAAAVHAEEFAQALGIYPAEKYERFGWKHQLRLVANHCPEDVAEYLRRLLFVIISGNTDAHHKNWGLVYPDGRRARLAPAYDQVATVVWTSADQSLADALPYKLDGSRRYEALTLGGFLRFLQSAGLPEFQDGGACVPVAEAGAWLRRVIQQIADHRGVADALGGLRLRRALDRHHARLPLLRGV